MLSRLLAEGMRFELTVHLYSVQRFSKPPPSATRPPLRRDATRRLPCRSRCCRRSGQMPTAANKRQSREKERKRFFFEKKKQKTFTLGQVALDRFVHQRRVALAAHGLHHLADKKAKQLLLAAPILRKLVRVGLQHRSHRGIDRTRVCHLP